MVELTTHIIVAISDGQRIAADPVAGFELGFEVGTATSGSATDFRTLQATGHTATPSVKRQFRQLSVTMCVIMVSSPGLRALACSLHPCKAMQGRPRERSHNLKLLRFQPGYLPANQLCLNYNVPTKLLHLLSSHCDSGLTNNPNWLRLNLQERRR